MMDRQKSIRFLRSSGLTPVKVRPGEKSAFGDWDARTAHSVVAEVVLRELELDTSLNLAALFHGRYIDLDFDNDDQYLKAVIDKFIPRTSLVWGRASKPKSHRVYLLDENLERNTWTSQLKLIKDLKIGDRSLSIELRGGSTSNGLYSVLPGSIHPSGELYEWDGASDPSVSPPLVTFFELQRGIRMAQAVALMSSYWLPGTRNEMSLALSGLMWRIRAATLSVLQVDDEKDLQNQEVFVLNDRDAYSLFETVLEVADENRQDHQSRRLNFKNTWKKLTNDPSMKITGGKRVAELIGEEGQEVVKCLYRLLSDNPDIEVLEDLTEKFCIWYGQGVLIDTHLVQKGLLKTWMSRDQATNSLGDQKIRIAGKKIPIVPLLFNIQTIRRVLGYTFDPSKKEIVIENRQGVWVNTWKGFDVEPCSQTVPDTQVEPFISYIREIVANNNEDVHQWLLAWLADIFQQPHRKPGTALVLLGVQGAGKTFLGEHIISKIIGKKHSAQTSSIQALTQKHNSDMEAKLFLQCDEAIHSYQKDIAARLKSLITEDHIRVEPKGVDAYETPNHMRYLFTSNEEHRALFIDPSPHERRFTVLKVNETRARDTEYWTHMHRWTGTNLDKILRWLMDYKYDKKLIRRPYDTMAKQDMQRQGIDAEVSWLISRIALGFPLGERHHQHWWNAFDKDLITEKDKNEDTLVRDAWPNTVHLPTIEADFRAYVREHGRTVYSGSITTALRSILPNGSLKNIGQMSIKYLDLKTGRTVKERPRMYSWPSSEDIHRFLKDRYGEIIDVVLQDEIAVLEFGAKNDQHDEEINEEIGGVDY